AQPFICHFTNFLIQPTGSMIMKKHYESTVKGGGTSYSAPSVEILSISIEKGFANSTVLDYGGAGEAGGSVNDTDYGEY
ncbi:hypothetical protein, partial [Alistipes putredinis]|uniref:hypothetical protein n=1 Tax=Alistipes putredinis TaxID=28117 RepID=UPI002FE0D51E